MMIDEEGGNTPHKAADHFKQVEKHLGDEERRLEELKEEIREAERKGKVVDPDPQR